IPPRPPSLPTGYALPCERAAPARSAYLVREVVAIGALVAVLGVGLVFGTMQRTDGVGISPATVAPIAAQPRVIAGRDAVSGPR
ncbi:MAG: hypothetical protein ACHQ02_05700, partial [Candidatus Limnocylindrales bacterium]